VSFSLFKYIFNDMGMGRREKNNKIRNELIYFAGKLTMWVFEIVGLIPTSVLLLGLFLIPESPRWLVRNQHTNSCFCKRKTRGGFHNIMSYNQTIVAGKERTSKRFWGSTANTSWQRSWYIWGGRGSSG